METKGKEANNCMKHTICKQRRFDSPFSSPPSSHTHFNSVSIPGTRSRETTTAAEMRLENARKISCLRLYLPNVAFLCHSIFFSYLENCNLMYVKESFPILPFHTPQTTLDSVSFLYFFAADLVHRSEDTSKSARVSQYK